MTNSWHFHREQALEDFLWAHLEPLLGITPLARQVAVQRQVCDILGVDAQQRLVVLELKNVEDRYVLPQLTRYYSGIQVEQPFRDQVDYGQPVRLLAIAPTYHPHNLLDREYSRLEFELWSFDISQEADGFQFTLQNWDDRRTVRAVIPSSLHGQLSQDVQPASNPAIPPPAKSLLKLTEALSPEQQAQVMGFRDHILGFDDRIAELGKTTKTLYGLRKGATGIYTSKCCAEVSPFTPGVYTPQLMVRLPYPKREFGGPGRTYKPEPVKGLAWARIWNIHNPSGIYFYLGRSRSRYSFSCSPDQYGAMYRELTGNRRVVADASDLLQLALEEWQQAVDG
jgi:hypothetical protein